MNDWMKEMEVTAELVREQLGSYPNFDLLNANGMELRIQYDPNAVWLRVGPRVVSVIESPGWWKAFLSSKERHAALLAHRMLHDWLHLDTEQMQKAG